MDNYGEEDDYESALKTAKDDFGFDVGAFGDGDEPNFGGKEVKEN